MIKRALTIAGSDSGGGAGIQTDLKTFENIGVFGMSAITAITAQNTLGVKEIHHIPAAMVAAQIDLVISDIGVDSVKIGMLSNAEIAEIVAVQLINHNVEKLVLDPVMVATSGDLLLEEGAIDTIKAKLFPLASIITPNKFEGELLANMKITNRETARQAAKKAYRLGPKGVLLKGGHLKEQAAVDIFYDGIEFYEFIKPRLKTKNTHGTGCTLAAAIAAYLCFDLSPAEAIAKAKDYVWERIKRAQQQSVGTGSGPICLPDPLLR